jgi:hypothetical protein
VLSLTIRLRYGIALDRELSRRVRNSFVRAVFGFLRRRGSGATDAGNVPAAEPIDSPSLRARAAAASGRTLA